MRYCACFRTTALLRCACDLLTHLRSMGDVSNQNTRATAPELAPACKIIHAVLHTLTCPTLTASLKLLTNSQDNSWCPTCAYIPGNTLLFTAMLLRRCCSHFLQHMQPKPCDHKYSSSLQYSCSPFNTSVLSNCHFFLHFRQHAPSIAH